MVFSSEAELVLVAKGTAQHGGPVYKPIVQDDPFTRMPQVLRFRTMQMPHLVHCRVPPSYRPRQMCTELIALEMHVNCMWL